jgi:hypothetical protein
MATLLATLPKHDQTTRCISAWAKKVLDEAGRKGFTVFELADKRACKREFESMIKKHKPTFVFLNGHGNSIAVGGNENEVLVQVGENENILKDTVTYALSCQSAKVLGEESVKAGARTYIGYKEDFIFLFDEEKRMRPEDDKLAGLFLEPSNQIAVSLIKGHSAHDSHLNGKKYFARNMQKMLTSQTSKADTTTLRYLYWNMNNLVCHGDGNATV